MFEQLLPNKNKIATYTVQQSRFGMHRIGHLNMALNGRRAGYRGDVMGQKTEPGDATSYCLTFY
jgi:hypothetical protein